MEHKRLITYRKIWCLIAISLILLSGAINNSFAKDGQSLDTAIKHLLAGRYPDAITEYYEIIEKDPQNVNAYYNLAVIIELILEDYESSMKFIDKALSIAENKKLFSLYGQEGMDKENIDNTIPKIKARKESLIQKIFNSIEGAIFPRYIVLKTGKTVSTSPFASNSEKSSISTTKTENEIRFIGIKNNLYQVATHSGELAWVKGDNIRLIYQNSNEKVMSTDDEKMARYKDFVNSFIDHKSTLEAKKKIKGQN